MSKDKRNKKKLGITYTIMHIGDIIVKCLNALYDYVNVLLLSFVKIF